MSTNYPLVAFDLDGTLADGLVFVWSLLHERFRSDPERRADAKRRFFAGDISYRRWFEIDIELLQERGATREAMIETFGAVQPRSGALEVLHRLEATGRRVAVISGSVQLLLEHLFPRFRFAHVLINRFSFDESGHLVGGTPTDYDLDRKAAGLAHIAALEGVQPADCVFVGDNENDIAALRLAGLGVAIEPRTPRVSDAADAVLEGPDLRPLLDLVLA